MPSSLSGHRILGKKMNKPKFVVALGGRQLSTAARNNQPNEHGSDGRGIGEDVRPLGNAGGAVFDRSGGSQVGRGEKI
jgi:hypothetical protein